MAINKGKGTSAGRALVVGAGIAGSAAAWWLHRAGREVVLVDDHSEAPAGGYVLDLSMTSQRILKAMGAEHITRKVSHPTPATSVRLGKSRWSHFRVPAGQSRLAHRAALIEGLLDHVPDDVDLRLGTRLTEIKHDAANVHAVFSDGTSGTFDIIVGADGVHSTVRELMITPRKQALYRNGISLLWFEAPHVLPTKDALLIPRDGALVFAYPDPAIRSTQIVAAVNFDDRHADMAPLQQRIADALNSAGSGLADIAAASLEATPLVTRFTQVRSETFRTRRTVLIGDAAHCIDPLSGLGAHGALLGSVTLARALEKYPSETDLAFSAYESHMRPFVNKSQQATARGAELVNRPPSRGRWETVAGAAGDALRIAPQLFSSAGRHRLRGDVTAEALGRLTRSQ